jgi:hypothetical protein
LSQARLAEIIGEPQDNIASGEVTDPPPGDVLPKLAKALGVEIADLIINAAKPALAQQKTVSPKLRRLFDQISLLPTRQQNTIIKVLSVFLENFHRAASPKSLAKLKTKAKSKSKSKLKSNKPDNTDSLTS